jgi:aerotaxis receptor
MKKIKSLQKVIKNKFTQKQIVLARATDKEIKIFDSSILISETDIEGIIVYTNRRYQALSGFSEEELKGSPHNIMRHPEMPRGVFKAMWKIISEKKIWRGYIKNLCKDGSFFWTLSYIQAKLDKQGEIIGYTSSSKVAYDERRKEVENKYKELMGNEHIDHEYFMISESYYKILK